jgi:hypothetical protein
MDPQISKEEPCTSLTVKKEFVIYENKASKITTPVSVTTHTTYLRMFVNISIRMRNHEGQT